MEDAHVLPYVRVKSYGIGTYVHTSSKVPETILRNPVVRQSSVVGHRTEVIY
jgi:hypothetical protein